MNNTKTKQSNNPNEWKFLHEGDGVEYEIWEKDGKEYSVPIEIVRDFENATLTTEE